ncbi:hypothetical protein HID58_036032 [Brassica napus]|uniref:Uncharacterized protein n=1 Tax=Brassica napus TaxID=3708 RepID=A0ABQ8C8L4_BRANA|nr:hypothetical protein HID58_036032 [Brassica napus]
MGWWTMIYINNFELVRNRDYRLKPKLSIFSAIGVICGVDHEDLKSINIISKSKEEPTGTCKTVTPRINSQMIIVFPGSPIKYEKNALEVVGKKFKKNNNDEEKPQKLEPLLSAVNNNDGSHIVHIPSEANAFSMSFSDIINRTVQTLDLG